VANATVRVLAVDDDPVNLAYLREALPQAGARATTSADAGAALELARRERFDLVLCDLRMPGLDGEAFLRALRASGASSGARVLAMSADLPPGERRRLRAAGFHDALAKPLAVATLAALVGGTVVAPPSEPTTGHPVLDDVHALRTLGSDDAVRALRALLASELPDMRAALAAADGDTTAQREVLHRLIGGAELCGALRLAQSARTLSTGLAATPPQAAFAPFDADLALTLAALAGR